MRQKRRQTSSVYVGSVPIGSDHPIVIQSMTNTRTADTAATLLQIKQLADAGSELVRITVNDKEAASAVPLIVAQLRREGYTVPIIGDFHYNGHILLSKVPACAQALDKYRINPGNVGKGQYRDDQFATMIRIAITEDKPVRIGVNWGSIDQDLFTKNMDANAKKKLPDSFKTVMIQTVCDSALTSLEHALSLGLSKNKAIISVKLSDVQDMIAAYRMIKDRCDAPLHIGLTEAGMGMKGIAATSAALSVLLQQGIGDTIRASLTPDPEVDRCQEVYLCRHLLQSMGFRYFMPSITACPGCGRTDSHAFIHLAHDTEAYIESQMPAWKQRYSGVESMQIAVMGCVVNGPGESKHANIGISLPGNNEAPHLPVYQDGQLLTTLKGSFDVIKGQFFSLINDYVKATYD